MKSFYKVVSEYCDDGSINTYSSVVEAENKPVDTFECLSWCDRYTDYFDDPVRAKKWMQDALEA